MAGNDSRALHRINIAVGVTFAVFAALQLNDPDPLIWILFYGAAAAACFAWGSVPPYWLWPAAVGLAALIWTGLLAPRVFPDLVLVDLVRPMDEKTPAIEEGREMLGLLIVAGWMVTLLVLSRRRRNAGR